VEFKELSQPLELGGQVGIDTVSSHRDGAIL
jgi:hypothetical protein